MKKKIGLLISTMNSGGAERVVSRLSELLLDKYDVYVILFEDTYMYYQCRGVIINLDVKSEKKDILKKVLLPLKRAKKLKKVKEELKLDVVISFMDSPNIVNILSYTKKCRSFLSVRNYTKKEKNISWFSKILDYIMRIIYNKADKVIAVSKVIENNLLEDYKVKKHKLCTIYNPYDVEEINRLKMHDLDKEEKEFINGNKVFISVGRQMYQKGFWHLIKAFKLVNDVDKDTRLIIVGKDYQNGKVEKLINKLGLENKVLLTGYQENPFKYINNSYAYILTSIFEGFPNSMAEALACGKAIIATDCDSGPREILDGEEKIGQKSNLIEYVKYGVLVPELSEIEDWEHNNIEKEERILAKAMIEMLNNKQKYQYYCKQSSQRIKDFSYEVCRRRFIDIIDEDSK